MVIFLAHATTTFIVAGMMWFLQLVHYPLLAEVGEATFVHYEQRHTRLAVRLVVSLMVVESLTGGWLLWRRPPGISPGQVWIGLVLLGMIWLSTFAWQVPQHHVLATGFHPEAHRKLVSSNWIRTLCYSGRLALVLWMLLSVAGRSG